MAWYDPTSWFEDTPTTTPVDDGGTVTQVDSPTYTWNPDIGWVDASGSKVSVPVNYGMTQGVDGTSMGGFDTADPNFSFDKYMSGEYKYDPSSTNLGNTIANIIGQVGTGAFNAMKSNFTDSKGNVNWAKLAGVGGGILGLINPSWMNTQQKPVGFTGGIPSYTAVREQVPGTFDPNRRPGSVGQEYFTDVQYSKPSEAATAKATAAQQATAAEARNKARTAAVNTAPPRQEYAAGGIAALAKGTYLAGTTDGMADRIPATIENKQPAKLSHGEFVIPADVVSHLGNGNSDAGAQRLYSMMDKVRKARTGTTKQGKQINPNKFMPG